MDGMTMTDDQTTNTAGESTGCRCMHCAGQDLHHDLRLSREDTQRVRTALAPLYPDEPPTVRVGWLAGKARSEIDRLRAELGTAREMRPPTGMWQVSVGVPASLPRELLESLFEAVAATAHGWEPQDRDGWDVDVSGHPTYQPCPDARAHTGGLPDDCGHPEHISARQIRDCLAQPAEENTARVRVLIDQYAAEDPGDGEFEAGFRRGDVAPEAFDALRAATGHNSEIDQRIGAALLKAQRPAGESGDAEARPPVGEDVIEQVARTIVDTYERYGIVPGWVETEAPNVAREVVTGLVARRAPEVVDVARYALDQLGRCIDAVDHIVMDTEEDRARHAQVVEKFRKAKTVGERRLSARRAQDQDGEVLAVLHRLGYDVCDSCAGRGGSGGGACGDCSGTGAKEIQEDPLATIPEAQQDGGA